MTYVFEVREAAGQKPPLWAWCTVNDDGYLFHTVRFSKQGGMDPISDTADISQLVGWRLLFEVPQMFEVVGEEMQSLAGDRAVV